MSEVLYLLYFATSVAELVWKMSAVLTDFPRLFDCRLPAAVCGLICFVALSGTRGSVLLYLTVTPSFVLSYSYFFFFLSKPMS